MTGHLTDIVVPEVLVGSFHADGQLRINVYRTNGSLVRLEAISLDKASQVHFTFSPDQADKIADLIKQAAQPERTT